MFSYVWPIALVVLSNTVYHVCSKAMPEALNPFFAMFFTYLTGVAVSAGLYFALRGNESAVSTELRALSPAPFVLGIVIVGLETGFIYAYKAGWAVSTASVVQSSILAVVLIGVGALLYSEKITLTKLLGLAICMVGLYFINK